MPAVLPFTSAAKKHRELLFSTTFTPGSAATTINAGSLQAIKAYPYIRGLWVHVTGATGTGGNLAADAPWNVFQGITLTDTNGSAIYGSPLFTGYDAYVTHLFGGHANVNDPTTYPFYLASATVPEFAFRIPLEFDARTGAGSLPNMSANAPYNLQLIGNTSANIWQTAPTTIPTLTIAVTMECWSLPAPQDLAGRNQMQGPAMLGTTQYVTKQSYTGLTASSSNTITLTRKGNLIRKWIVVSRNSSQARIATATNLPNPFEFWWDSNRLTSDEPKYLQALACEQNVLSQSSGLAVLPTGVVPYDWSAAYEINYGGDGAGGWLATTQSSRLELLGAAWGSSASQIDVITMDVAPIALSQQYALDSQTGKLLYPAQPETRG